MHTSVAPFPSLVMTALVYTHYICMSVPAPTEVLLEGGGYRLCSYCFLLIVPRKVSPATQPAGAGVIDRCIPAVVNTPADCTSATSKQFACIRCAHILLACMSQQAWRQKNTHTHHQHTGLAATLPRAASACPALAAPHLPPMFPWTRASHACKQSISPSSVSLLQVRPCRKIKVHYDGHVYVCVPHWYITLHLTYTMWASAGGGGHHTHT